MKKLILILSLAIALVGCSATQEQAPVEYQYKTVMECIQDAKLKDRDMKLVGEKVKVLDVEEFITWYNTTFYSN